MRIRVLPPFLHQGLALRSDYPTGPRVDPLGRPVGLCRCELNGVPRPRVGRIKLKPGPKAGALIP